MSFVIRWLLGVCSTVVSTLRFTVIHTVCLHVHKITRQEYMYKTIIAYTVWILTETNVRGDRGVIRSVVDRVAATLWFLVMLACTNGILD